MRNTKNTRRTGAALALVGALAACGGGSSDSESASVAVITAPLATPTPSPTSAPNPTPSPPSTPIPAAVATTWGAAAASLYDVQPDASACRAGTLKASVKAEFLTRLNAIRALHQLAPVSYSELEDAQEAESSLMMAVNRQLSHTPPSSWSCYTAVGAAAAGSSNLIGGWGTGLGFNTEDDYLGSWLTEIGSASIGHRRWILNPFLGKTSYGRVAVILPDGRRASAASMKVFNFAVGGPAPGNVPAFVAYPYGDYPARYFDTSAYLSFSAAPGKTNAFGANASVSFSRASITVTGPNGMLAVTDVSSDNDGYGLANNVQWHVAGLQQGSSYVIKISGVTGSSQSEYTYSFRILAGS